MMVVAMAMVVPLVVAMVAVLAVAIIVIAIITALPPIRTSRCGSLLPFFIRSPAGQVEHCHRGPMVAALPGIEVYGGFIFGGDEDTPTTTDRIVEFVKRTRIFTAMTGNNTDDEVQFEPLVRKIRDDRSRMEELVGQAQDYLVRFRPDERLEQVREWIDGVRKHVELGSLSARDARAVYESAARYVKAQMRGYRFPGITFEKAIEAAIKGLHYEKVMSPIVEGAPPYRAGGALRR